MKKKNHSLGIRTLLGWSIQRQARYDDKDKQEPMQSTQRNTYAVPISPKESLNKIRAGRCGAPSPHRG